MTVRVRWCAAVRWTLAVILSATAGAVQADVDLPTKFGNTGGVSNTRHNLTQRQASGGPAGVLMDPYRNDYGEVCVYCHTPHGANSNVTLPLWNRTIRATSYTTYAALGTVSLTQPVTQPGASSRKFDDEGVVERRRMQRNLDALVRPADGPYRWRPRPGPTVFRLRCGQGQALEVTAGMQPAGPVQGPFIGMCRRRERQQRRGHRRGGEPDRCRSRSRTNLHGRRAGSGDQPRQRLFDRKSRRLSAPDAVSPCGP